MKIDKRCFWNGAFGAFMVITVLFLVTSCGALITEAIEYRGKNKVCLEAIKKEVYQQLEECK